MLTRDGGEENLIEGMLFPPVWTKFKEINLRCNNVLVLVKKKKRKHNGGGGCTPQVIGDTKVARGKSGY